MESNNLKQEIYNHYIDMVSGLVNVKPDEGQNAIGNSIYRDIFFLILLITSKMIPYDRVFWFLSVKKSEVKDKDGNPVYGLYNRSFYKTDELQAFDDYIGLLTVSLFIDNGITAREVLVHGLKNNWNGIQIWNWNNLEPYKVTFRTWFGRYLCFIPHLYYCSKIKSSFFINFKWTIGFLLSLLNKKENTTEWIHTWFYFHASVDIDSWIVQSSRKLFLKVFIKKYPNGLRDLFNLSFGPEHPLTKYSPIL